ncbi:MauE/DoxX family redox-associated membrane protein [Microbacterium sp. HMH0099]|uniref:MauE/DoxX family redox-associated membrane protein n=1 Tax=Microbacterium sp. HMH0099 TaxID=3414026 RepID=UPI003BF6FB7C
MSAAYIVLAAVAAPFLVVSGAGKLAALGEAATTMRSLRLTLPVPRLMVGAVSVGEIGLGLLLLVSDGVTRIIAAGAVTLSMLGFWVIARRAVRAGSTADCGCLGRVASTPLSPAVPRRNLLFTALAGAMTVAAVLATAEQAPSVVGALLQNPARTFALVMASLVIAVVAGMTVAAAHRPSTDASPLAAHPRPVLIREDGLVVDVVQAALRGRAQLLLFSQPLCGRCEAAQDLLDRDHAELSALLDARIVYAAGHEVDWNGPARSADGPRTPSAIDPAGLLAHTLEIGSERPVAVLVGTDGRPVLPYANGSDELDQLLGVLALSRTPEVVQE